MRLILTKAGSFKRKCDGRKIQRYKCRCCGCNFSSATGSPNYRQRKRELNMPVYRLFCSGVSERRMAKLFKTHRRTISKKLLLMAKRCEKQHEAFLAARAGKIAFMHFDEMESFEHSKCKPLSLPLVVDARTRHILAFEVASMPAKGRLARIARKRYGFRKDERPYAIACVLKKVSHLRAANFKISTDKNPHYPSQISKYLPGAEHETVKGRRGCVVGQGELKRGGWDPLFRLNHTCAMFRANVNRLFRRTWCTTKKAERLRAHMMLYVHYHNNEILKAR